MRAAVISGAGAVVNVIAVEDETFDPGDGMTLVALADDSPVGEGWTRSDEEWVAPPERLLIADRLTIPADGTTAATVTYTDTFPDAPEQVVFTVNGAIKTVTLTSAGNAFLDVVSSTPGDTIVVTVDALADASITITVEGS